MNDAELMDAFIARRITHAEWTHQAHLRIAWLFVRDRPLDEAHCAFRIALIKLNDSHGVPESPTRGYHETLTRAWLAVVADLARQAPTQDSTAFLDRFPALLDKLYLSRHYSPERILTVAARAAFVAPDRRAIPGLG